MTDSAAAQPLVSIIMGSDSDWPTMRAAAETLEPVSYTHLTLPTKLEV